jgi:uncharacterized protein VirK/YbjX
LCFRADTLPLYRRLQKPLRPYLNKSYNAEERLNALQEHFYFLKLIFCINQISFSAIKSTGLTLAVFACKKQIDYEILLAETDQFDREGEFRLTLRDVNSKTQIAVIAFSLATTPELRIDIGCLQGPQSNLGIEFIRKTTRDFYGIRPKNLLMFALYDVARIWGIRSIRAINNKQQIYAKKEGLFKNSNYAKADYDGFWKELRGDYKGQGWFKLPEQLLQHPIEEIPSKHRSEHRRKLKVREEIRNQIILALNSVATYS